MYFIKGYQFIIELIRKNLKISDENFSLASKTSQEEYRKFLEVNSSFNINAIANETKFTNGLFLKEYSLSLYAELNDIFVKNDYLLDFRLETGFFYDSFLAIKDRNPELYELCNFLIKLIILNKMNDHVNGSKKDRIGIFIFDFKDNYTKEDFIEITIHQLTHMILFLDHIITPHIDEDNEKRNIPVDLKFIRGGHDFPVYLAFHSYIVGVEILTYRLNYKTTNEVREYHGSTKRIFSVTEKFRQAIERNIVYFTNNGLKLFQEVSDIFNDLKNDMGYLHEN